MINKIKEVLSEIGLNEKEIIILSTLFQYKNVKASFLSQKTQLNRTTVYVVLKSLIKKGLVSSAEKYGITEFQAINPVGLISYIDRQKEMLEQKKSSVQEILPELESIHASSEAAPKISFFEGVEGVRQAYEDTLENNKNKIIYVFSGPDIVFKEMGKDYVEYYVNKRKRLDIKSFQVAPDTSWGKYIKSKDKEFIRKTKLIPKEFSFDTEMVMYDNKVGIFSFSKEKLLAVIIEDSPITNTLMSLFRYIDSTLKNSKK